MFSHPGAKGVSALKRGYQLLQQHIHEAHHSGASCALCESLIYLHLGEMILLEAAKEDFTDVKINLWSSLMTLRDHIQEAHGGC